MAFKEANNDVSPSQIVVFRASTSEGQNETIRVNEISQLRNAILKLEEAGEMNEDTKFCFLVANKKVEQRFWQTMRGRFVNPEKGMVIESGLTRNERFEFYMISHAGPTGLQGPVRYEVLALENWNTINPKDLYDLTYSLCFGYFNF